jgi:flagellar basal body rod protein FlgB
MRFFKINLTIILSWCLVSSMGWALDTEGMLFDKSTKKLARAVQETSQMQAIYSYNIANSATPGFVPLNIERVNGIIQNTPKKEFNLEEEMAKMNQNRLHHHAYIKLFTTKVSITQRILTLGKGG